MKQTIHILIIKFHFIFNFNTFYLSSTIEIFFFLFSYSQLLLIRFSIQIFLQGSSQLYNPNGMLIDDDQNIFIADTFNDRIVEWKNNSNHSQIVAGGNGQESRNDQLTYPTSVIIDQQNDSLIICDRGNGRVVRRSRQNGRTGEILISDINCYDLKMYDDGYLHVSDLEKHEIRRWKIGENNGTLVAGGTGGGNRNDQLNTPTKIFIDKDHSVYVSDKDNHRVMK